MHTALEPTISLLPGNEMAHTVTDYFCIAQVYNNSKSPEFFLENKASMESSSPPGGERRSAAVSGCESAEKTPAEPREARDTHPGLTNLWWERGL